MMTYLYVRQTVENYSQWKEAFDNHLLARQAGGATREALVLRNVDEPQMAMQKMGVVGAPEVRFLEGVG